MVAFGGSDLIRGVVCLEGNNLLGFFTVSVHLKSGLIRGMAFDGSDLKTGGELSYSPFNLGFLILSFLKHH